MRTISGWVLCAALAATGACIGGDEVPAGTLTATVNGARWAGTARVEPSPAKGPQLVSIAQVGGLGYHLTVLLPSTHPGTYTLPGGAASLQVGSVAPSLSTAAAVTVTAEEDGGRVLRGTVEAAFTRDGTPYYVRSGTFVAYSTMPR